MADGVTQEIGCARPRGISEIDAGGAWLIPGLVDLHSDAIEKWIEPRPNVHFPHSLAFAQADVMNALHGITTPFHSISFADGDIGLRNAACAERLVCALANWTPHSQIHYRCHCRYEVTDPDSLQALLRVMAKGHAHMVSFMDHTPGRGQFKDTAAYRTFLMTSAQQTFDEADCLVARKLANADSAPARIAELAAAARQYGLPLAAHDQDQPELIPGIAKLGVSICEFPINIETAREAKRRNMTTVFGAPNLLRGESQNGSMRAIEGIREGVADCLCSDYLPAALINAVFSLARRGELPLAAAVRLVTANPATAAGLTDRGVLQPGKRADLVLLVEDEDLVLVRRVWVDGKRIAAVYPRGEGK